MRQRGRRKMKIISKSDLLILIPLISDLDSFDLDDFETILERFGDAYFWDGLQLTKTAESSEMAKLRNYVKEKKNG